MALFGRSRQSDISIVFDIGSSSVGGAVVEYDENELPVLLFSSRRAIAFKKDFDFEHFFSSMVESFEAVTMDVLTSLTDAVEDISETIKSSRRRTIGSRRIEDVYCVFGSPWYQAQILTFEDTFKQSKLVTESTVIEIAKKAGEQLRAQFEDPQNVSLLENSILDYTLNGYRVAHEQSMRARSVGVNVYTSCISKDSIAAVKLPLRRGFGVRKVSSFSFLMTFFSVLRELHPHKGNFVTVDIRGEVTEIGVVKDDALVKVEVFPFGRYTLARAIAAELDIEVYEAHSRLAMYTKGGLEENEYEQIEKILDTKRKAFIKQLHASLEHVLAVPKTFFLISDKEIESYFKETLDVGIEELGGGRETVLLDENVFERHAEVIKLRYRDRFLSLAALFIGYVRKGRL